MKPRIRIFKGERPSKKITMWMPLDVLEDLKRIAEMKGMVGYQSLIKFYVSQGVRDDLAELWKRDETAERLREKMVEFGLDEKQGEELLGVLIGNSSQTGT